MSGGSGVPIVRYFGVNITSTLIGLGALAVFVELIHINVYITNVLAVGVTTSGNFIGSKFFAFRAA